MGNSVPESSPIRTTDTFGPVTLEPKRVFGSTEGVASERVILFLGAPGSGKGTQSSWLSGQLGIPALSTGDMLRREAKRNTARGRKLRGILASGALVDDGLVCDAVDARLRQELPGRGIILDGFPRTTAQAQRLDDTLADLGIPGPLVLHLDISRECIISRLTSRRQCPECGVIFNLKSRPSWLGSYCENDGALLVQRDDDTKAVILRRLKEFDLVCAPLVEHYGHANYHRVDADEDTESVSAALLAIVGRVAGRVAA